MSEYCAVAPDVKLGRGVKLSRFINLYGCAVGDETKIGAFVEVQKNMFIVEKAFPAKITSSGRRSLIIRRCSLVEVLLN